MIAWATVEDALRAWVVAGSGLPDAKVLWSAQDMPRPIAPYAVVRVTSLRGVGQDWLDVEDNPDSTGSDGLEIVQKARGIRRCTLGLQYFADAATGSLGAVGVLDAVASASRLPSIREALTAAGIGLADLGQARSLDGVLNRAHLEPRAVADHVFYLASEVEEFGTIIETAAVEGTLTSAGGTERTIDYTLDVG